MLVFLVGKPVGLFCCSCVLCVIVYTCSPRNTRAAQFFAEAALLPLGEPSVYIKLYPGKCSTISLCADW